MIGWLSSLLFVSRIVSLFDYLLEHTPGVKFIYGSVKDFFEAFTGNKRKFNKPVLANIDDNDVWRVGFITREEAKDFGFTQYVAVYIPMSYSIAGNVYILPKARVRVVPNLNGTDAMKFAISGGVTEVEERG